MYVLAALALVLVFPVMVKAETPADRPGQEASAPAQQKQEDADRARYGDELELWRQRIDQLASDARNSEAAAALDRSWQRAKADWDRLEQAAGPAYDSARHHLDETLADIRRQWAQTAQTPEPKQRPGEGD